MDFSKYGTPSKQWLELVAANPAVARDGYSGNDPLQAEELRQTANKLRESVAEGFMASTGLNCKVKIDTSQVSSRDEHMIPIRRYVARNAPAGQNLPRALLFFHGGGMLFGSENTDDVLCSRIAVDAGITVISVIYRHTPQHKHPAQHNDAWDAFQAVRDGASDLGIDLIHGIAVMGISAGAGLAAGVVLRELAYAKTRPGYSTVASGLVLSIPWLIHIDNYPFENFVAPEKASKIQCQTAPVVPVDRLMLFTDILASERVDDPLLNIALAPDAELSNWPRTAFLEAGMDPLRDDGLLFATRLEALG